LSQGVTAIVLAGGMGTRFHPYTEIIPKPMIPIGVDEKPVLEYIVKWLSRFGVKKYVFLVNYRWRYIQNYFGDGSRFNVEITYSIDEPNGYTNTGGSILKAYREGLFAGTAIIWYGDILAPLDVKDLLNHHQSKRGDLTLVVTKKYKVPVGVATLGSDFSIIEMREKPDLDINATIGVGVLETKILDDDLEEKLGLNFDFMGDLIPWLITKRAKIYGYVYNEDWFDVGSLEKYKKLDNNYLRELFKL
jgi:Nucleoside-diphosphate-sugar pyrophosphorylase involved in lipopolysaccharide biosynthesis/translation initiation factor 2B, gamma/epsilon subunits (eIF-2Bgamma/eIF-2Bepsilon)